jgi:hypothetical protein
MTASLLMSKIINFNHAKLQKVHPRNSTMKSGHAEQRQFKRRASSDRLFAQIVSCDEQPDLVGSTISCCARNVSAGGLRIQCYEYIPQGSQLDLWVDINSRPGKFFLTSDVRWVSKNIDAKYSFDLGVELHEGAATDIEEWRHIHQ